MISKIIALKKLIYNIIENFDDYKDFEILMIEIYLNKIFDIFKIIMLIFHEFDDNKYFLIMNIIITFNE